MRTRWLVAASLGLAVLAGVWAVAGRGGGRPSEEGADGARAGDGGPGSPAVTWTWSVVVDSGGGRVGPWRMNRSDWRYVDDPTVALAPGGDAAVAWVDQARKDVFFQRYLPGRPRHRKPVDVSRSPDVFSWLPRVAVAPDDGSRVDLVWQEIVFSGGTHGGEIFFARSGDGGRTFGSPVNLSETEAGAGKGRLTPRRWHNGSLDLAHGPRDGVYVAWTVYEGGLWLARSRDGGESFSEPREVTRGAGSRPARGPTLAVGPDGTVHLAWAVGERPAEGLRYATSRDGGRSFGAARVLFGDGGHADAPKLAVDAEGTVHLAWAESPAGQVGAHRVRYARSPAGVDDFRAPLRVAGPEGEVAGVHFPSLDLDGDGDPHLVWEIFPRGSGRSRGLGFAASRDGGRTFSDPAVVPGTRHPGFSANGSLQGLFMRKLSVDASGGVAVVNSSFEPGVASRIRLVRGRAESAGGQ